MAYGKENGNYYSILGFYGSYIGIMEKKMETMGKWPIRESQIRGLRGLTTRRACGSSSWHMSRA